MTLTSKENNKKYIKVNLPKIVGAGYKDFWQFKGRYRVVKGSRASKKSKTTAINFIHNLMKYPDSNLLVVRKVFRTLKDSCFTDLKWAINRLKVKDYWEIKESPLEMTYKPTGQKILFRGLDDPMKITSITVETGVLCWCWIEEAYEITKEKDFDMLNESIRGEVPENLYKQITLTFNPWNQGHWLKKRFFDAEDPDIMAKTTNYQCNEFLDESDKKLFEDMKVKNPRRYRVAGLGEWGIVEGLIYENWEEQAFNIEKLLSRTDIKTAFGLDFGYTNDPSGLFCGAVDKANRVIYVFDELYKSGLSNRKIAEEITRKGYSKERIRADSAEPKSIDNLRDDYRLKVKPARKGKDSINNGIQYIQDYKIIIHPRCVNFITEISNYTWDTDTKTGKKINRPIDDFNQASSFVEAFLTALEYTIEQLNSDVGNVYRLSWSN